MAAKKQAVTYATPEYIPCAFVGCPTSATLRVREKTGWANVCAEHDKAIVQKRADALCKSMGLDTVQKQREWVLKRLKIKPLKANIERQTTPKVEIEDEAESIPF